MLSFAPDGSAYPCIRYAPISIGEEKSKKVRFGSVYDGLYTTDAQRKAKAELDAITLTSQSEQKCIYARQNRKNGLDITKNLLSGIELE